MARGILWIVLAMCSLLLVGCSGVMRPPSAVAFMNSYEKRLTVVNASVAMYGGDLDNDESSYNHEIDMEDEHLEWPIDISNIAFGNVGYFSAGFGFQSTTPFFQLGFVSPYIGVSAWSSICLPKNCFYENGYVDNLSYGTMLVQQLPVGRRMKIGFTEHFSRNGSERYFYEVPEFFGIVIREPHPIFYREVGGGFFVALELASIKIATEFRYGRDIDFERNRFAVTMDFSHFFLKGKNGGRKQRRQELKKVLKELHETAQEISVRKRQMKQRIREERERGEENLEKTEEEKRQLRELRKTLDQQKMKIRELE